MSGSVAAAVVGLADLAVSLFGGGNQAVSLGSFVFAGYEVPERISWGGQQALSIKRLVGGARVIDSLGRDDADIAWSGIFLSSDASERADKLDSMRVDGFPQELIFAGRYYSVVIRSFRADQRKTNHVPYSISCSVLQDVTAARRAAEEPSFLSQIMDDINSALGFDVGEALSEAQDFLQTVTPIVVPLVSLVGGTNASIAIASGLGSAQAVVGAAGALANGQLAGLTLAASAAGNVIGASSAPAATAAMLVAADAAAIAAQAANMGSFVGRALKNLGNI